MTEPIKRDDIAAIHKKLDECKLHVKRNNVYSCLSSFKEAMEKFLHTRMLPVDEKDLLKIINEFQYDLSHSATFKNIYGPVTFAENDIPTAVDFVGQLLQLREDEIQAEMLEDKPLQPDDTADNASAMGEESETRIRMAQTLLDRGDFGQAQETLGNDDVALAMILQICNSRGIVYRKAGDHDKAIAEYRKALYFHPDDEGLYYNVSRAYIEKQDWNAAAEAIQEGLKVNPEFREGKNLLAYIKKQLS